ncbi:MAG: APC family permease [Malacoplasma sp.]
MNSEIQVKSSKKTKEEKSLAAAPTSKKIGFFSAMLIVMGSSIGAGIFFKSKAVIDGAHGNLILAIAAWLISAFAVIAMALALIEIASARNDNLSLIGWCKTFNSRIIYKASRNFMFYIYLPLTYFFMPLYVIMSLQDGISALAPSGSSAFGTDADWVIWTIISLLISTYFIVMSGMSSRVGNIQNLIITAIKFVPLVVAACIGFVFVGIEGVKAGSIITDGFRPGEAGPTLPSFSSLSPGLGMFIAIAGIFFAYDGFYVTAGIQTEMKEPKKTPWAILAGLAAVTIIYLIIAISMSLNGNGSFFGFGDWLAGKGLSWLFGLVNILIAIGVLGIINGFAMWAPRFIEDLIRERELPFSEKYINKLSDGKKPMVGIAYSAVLTYPIVILFTIIGALAYIDNYTFTDDAGALVTYGTGMGSLYTFADLMANWTALLAFAFIALPIYGGVKNRWTKKVETQQNKYFVPMGIIAVSLIGITLLMQTIAPIFDILMLIGVSASGANVPISTSEVVGRSMLIVVLVLFIGILFAPTFIEDFLRKRKGGDSTIEQSIAKDEHKKEKLDKKVQIEANI